MITHSRYVTPEVIALFVEREQTNQQTLLCEDQLFMLIPLSDGGALRTVVVLRDPADRMHQKPRVYHFSK